MKKSKALILLSAAIFIVLAATIAQAKTDTIPLEDYQNINKNIGIDIGVAKEGSNTKVVVTFDENRINDYISFFQAAGAMNKDITQTAINMMPVTLSSVAADDIAVSTLMELYNIDPTIDDIKFIVRMDISDEYGNENIKDILSFNFSRSIFQKINWDKMQPKNLEKVARNFHYSKWVMSKMRDEIGQ